MMSAPLPLTSLYERDTPMMSRAISLKVGEKVEKHFVFADPVHFFTLIIGGVGK